MRALWRVILVLPVAFIAAAFAASIVIVVSAGIDPAPGEPLGEYVGKLFIVSAIASPFVGAIAFIPALIVIIPAEAFGWRSLTLHLLVGAGIGFAALVADIGGPSDVQTDLTVGGGAGAVGGLVYWLIAGRRAGIGEGGDVSIRTPDEGDGAH
jgi:hypothetical protein